MAARLQQNVLGPSFCVWLAACVRIFIFCVFLFCIGWSRCHIALWVAGNAPRLVMLQQCTHILDNPQQDTVQPGIAGHEGEGQG